MAQAAIFLPREKREDTAMPHTDIFRNYGYLIETEGRRWGYFTRIQPPRVEVGCIDYREGGLPGAVRKLPGQTTIGPIKCEWGITASREMWDWLMSAVSGRVQRRDISIIVLSTDGASEAMRWNCLRTWPCACVADEFRADGNGIAIETMFLQTEAVERAADVAQAAQA